MKTAGVRAGSKEEIVADLADWVRAGGRILVKGSRGMKMETVVAALGDRLGADNGSGPDAGPDAKAKR